MSIRLQNDTRNDTNVKNRRKNNHPQTCCHTLVSSHCLKFHIVEPNRKLFTYTHNPMFILHNNALKNVRKIIHETNEMDNFLFWYWITVENKIIEMWLYEFKLGKNANFLEIDNRKVNLW